MFFCKLFHIPSYLNRWKEMNYKAFMFSQFCFTLKQRSAVKSDPVQKIHNTRFPRRCYHIPNLRSQQKWETDWLMDKPVLFDLEAEVKRQSQKSTSKLSALRYIFTNISNLKALDRILSELSGPNENLFSRISCSKQVSQTSVKQYNSYIPRRKTGTSWYHICRSTTAKIHFDLFAQ